MFNDNLGFNPFDKTNDNADNLKKSYGVMDQAKYLLNNIMGCGQKNSQENTKYNFDEDNESDMDNNHSVLVEDSDGCCGGSCHNKHDATVNLVSNPAYEQTKLLKTVVEFLNQVSTPLYFSNNRFLSSAAKELANKLSDNFCIG